MNNVPELLKSIVNNAGERFQEAFAKFVGGVSREHVVETGEGVSTLYLLRDIDDMNLYSIDPNPWSNFGIKHPKHRSIRIPSYKALPALFKEVGDFDVFLHDSNHDIKCMTFELEFAWGTVKPTGYIACDDWTWGNHRAWHNFIERHGLAQFEIGSLAVVRKPYGFNITKAETDEYADKCFKMASLAEAEWLGQGNKNTPIFEQP
jgi:hypothetical protein